MRYVIEITQKHLDLNSKLLKSNKIGDIKVFNKLPVRWNKIDGFGRHSNITQQQENGFYEAIERPLVYNERYKDWKAEDFDIDKFVREVEINPDFPTLLEAKVTKIEQLKSIAISKISSRYDYLVAQITEVKVKKEKTDKHKEIIDLVIAKELEINAITDYVELINYNIEL